MRPAAIVLSASLAVAFLFGFLGRSVDSEELYFLAGVAFLVAFGAGIALIPWVQRLPWPPRMEGLFPRLCKGQRLDPITGERR